MQNIRILGSDHAGGDGFQRIYDGGNGQTGRIREQQMYVIRLSVNLYWRTAYLCGCLSQRVLDFVKDDRRHDLSSILRRENQMDAEFCNTVATSFVVCHL